MEKITVQDFVAQLSSSEPTPGGGAASAMAATLASSLGSMVGNIKREKAETAELKDLLNRLEVSRTKLMNLVDEDQAAFAKLSAAFKMPKQTEEEKQSRQDQLGNRLLKAASVPLEISRTIVDVLHEVQEMQHFSTKSLISDIGCAAALAAGAIKAAVLNVYVNTKLMKDKEAAQVLNEQTEAQLEAGLTISDRIYQEVLTSVKG
ncbi:cyclodeaminase/cyclohydrolase family protein [Lentilactobacillus sp. Marseille-Q4993]|uniref:cyclodeaminase/cyclohydrolase family protein n=1 Tax=Lentilactobacillus sp. Marseille-Q4993 TaxID=3039492 RepID=UPI0024BD3A55|nr:cyclodeaminase/cyclohydrolase family protein [Lentilactobacillus sp. Marseille-Q4993]